MSAFAEKWHAVDLCLGKNLVLPALVLIYSGIDVVSSLEPRPNGVTRRDQFCRWAERYMQAKTRLGVTGLDLYAARCGVLHGYGSDSDLSRQGKARPLIYAWGKRDAQRPNEMIGWLGLPQIMVHVGDLDQAFRDGVMQWLGEVGEAPARLAEVRRRAGAIFTSVRSLPGLD